jgi:hypothetical protein
MLFSLALATVLKTRGGDRRRRAKDFKFYS